LKKRIAEAKRGKISKKNISKYLIYGRFSFTDDSMTILNVLYIDKNAVSRAEWKLNENFHILTTRN
jgi:hypothetical protein